jgi:hypothetical protein
MLGLVAGLATAADAKERQTFAVVIGNNTAPDDQTEALSFADDDAARWAEMLGAVAREMYLLTRFDTASAPLYSRSSTVLAPPTPDNVRTTLARVGERIRAAQSEGSETRLFLVFVGHGVLGEDRMGSLVLEGGALTRDELVAHLAVPGGGLTHRTHLIIDACNAWFMVHDRGTRLKPWRNDRSSPSDPAQTEQFLRGRVPDGLGLVLATSGAQQSHETAALNGGVFSHAVRSALTGAADADGDQRVTYDELHAFVRAASASIQHAQAPAVYVQAPARTGAETLTAVGDYRRAATLTLPPGMNGHFRMVDARGLPYAELNRAGDGPATQIALVDGGFGAFELVHRRPGAEPGAALLMARPGEQIDAGTLVYQPPTHHAARGLLDDAFRQGLFATPYGLGVLNLVRGLSATEPGNAAGGPEASPNGLAVDAGPIVAGSTRPGSGPDGVAFGATLGASATITAGVSLGARVQYDHAETDEGALKHFVGGLAPRVRLHEGSEVVVDAEGLLGVDMVLATRRLGTPDDAGRTAARDQSVFDPDNLTGQAVLGVAWRFADPLRLRAHVGYAVTSAVDLVFEQDVTEKGVIHRPVGGLALEVAP